MATYTDLAIVEVMYERSSPKKCAEAVHVLSEATATPLANPTALRRSPGCAQLPVPNKKEQEATWLGRTWEPVKGDLSIADDGELCGKGRLFFGFPLVGARGPLTRPYAAQFTEDVRADRAQTD